MRWLAALAAASTTFTLHLGQYVGLTSARFEPAAVSFVSGSRGWELGRAGCDACAALRTTFDGGRTWASLPALHLGLYWYGGAVSDVAFADVRDGYLFGPRLYSTHDGGRSWSRRSLPVASLHTGAGYAYALTPTGALWRTPVGRDDWRRVLSVHDRNGVQLAVERRTVAVLGDGYTGPGPGIVGSIRISGDAGRTWLRASVPCPPGGGGAAALALTLGRPSAWLVDCYDNLQSSQEQHTRHRLYATADAGRRWRLVGVPSHDGNPGLLAATGKGIFFTTESGGADELHASFDGGRSFRVLFPSGGGDYGWADLAFVDDRTGFVVGPTHFAPEHVYRTDDGGRRWRLIDTG